ncbi:MAG: radical SAM family heme chaperone HemW [Gammaproteobacteria bacterium]|nr:radical SAM family heme chaperone HemW [Gammaproteobacteria bacterium]
MNFETPLSLYIHFPWCVSKCPYCDFNSHVLREDVPGRERVPEESYVTTLLSDLASQCESQATLIGGRRISTVFMGGGTPSLFSPSAIGRVIDAVRAGPGLAVDAEITLEANPGTIERGRFTEYAAAGVNRVSLGAQSFDAEALRKLGRIHSSDETRNAAAELHAAGLSNFNIDLMYGLPEQDKAGALRDIEAALALRPTQISHYHLTLEPGTPFAARPPSGLPLDEHVARMLEVTSRRLAEDGYRQYEVSAYAREGFDCAHNLVYWSFGDYLGIGAGAHGKLSGPRADGGIAVIRSVQPREPRRYQRDPKSALVWQHVEDDQRPFEFMLNALRLTVGFEIELFERRTGLNWEVVNPVVQRLRSRGLLSHSASSAGRGRISATPIGRQFLNEVLLEFLPEDGSKSMHSD